MKDYAINRNKRKNFILNYQVKNDQIIINYASKKSKKIPYTKEAENRILNKMEKQVNDFDQAKFVRALNEEAYFKDKIIKKTLNGFIPVGIAFIALSIFTGQFIPVFCLVGSAIFVMSGIEFGNLKSVANYRENKYNEVLKDIAKQKKFIEHKKEINYVLKKKNENEVAINTIEEMDNEQLNELVKDTYNTIYKKPKILVKKL